jgi:hypothetical protein
MMPTWGVVTTVRAPEEQILAFVAHHLALGAARIWVYFDDPADPAHDRIARLPRITAIRCTDWYWALRGGRDRRHQSRQVQNARHAQHRCRLDWLTHVDVDEYIHAARPVAEILAEVPGAEVTLRMEPFEALHDPGLPDDIFTARRFRGPLQEGHAPLIPAVFGPMAPLLAKGSLAHGLGKCFLRPRTRGVDLDLHFALVRKARLMPPFHPDLRLLHFHAENPDAWRRALPFRLAKGAYHHPVERPLHAYLAGAGEAELQRFYEAAMMLTPEKAALLEAQGRLVTADLGLRAKVERLLAGACA